MVKNKPELLAPVGNVESFYAALSAGADAIYLGLQEFNARGRASNFTKPMLQLAVRKAHEKNVKVYVTLNILIKNREIEQLIDVLAFLASIKIDGIIIQDWGVYYIARKFFPNINLHASTQMGNHNSVGVNYGFDKGIIRTVLARELTMPELKLILKRSKAEIELFVHGALCYSFSGMCLFSSYSGGQGANRGLCKQSCRRLYQCDGESHAIFSLKDNQQILSLQELIALGVHSFKVEGRMKSADYVFQVCNAYRMAIDNFSKIPDAVNLLKLDMGREKTSYFINGNLHQAITDDPSVGIRIGNVSQVNKTSIVFDSTLELASGYRVRIRKSSDDQQIYVRIDDFSKKGNIYEVSTDQCKQISKGDEVLLVRVKTQSFSSRLGNVNMLPELRKIVVKKAEIKRELLVGISKTQNSMLLVRIGDPEWLPKLRFDDYSSVILSYKREDWIKFDFKNDVLKCNKHKVRIELPKFISEKHLDFYRELAVRFVSEGYNHFFISHLSQKKLLPKGVHISCNENVYVLNDASARFIHEENVEEYIYPFENDIENLLSMNNRQGIVPLYFYPQLFYSRMPVKVNTVNKFFSDETNKKFRVSVRDGITSVYPLIPVSLFHYRNQLEKNGFNCFLIDYSGETINSNVVKRILKKFINAESVLPSTTFNFKLGLK